VYLFSLKEPSSRLTKFRLLLEEYTFTVEYSPGKENCTADALSRIELDTEYLKTLSVNVVTRSQRNKSQEATQEKTPSTQQNKNNTVIPTVQELLKPPEHKLNVVELKIVTELQENIKELEGQDIIIGPSKVLAYVPSKNCLLWKWTHDSTSTPCVTYGSLLQRDVEKICGPLLLKKVFMFKEELKKLCVGRPYTNNINNLKKTINELWKNTNITVHIMEKQIRIKDPYTIKTILNDYHLLPTSGHAGITKMTKNIMKKYCWTGLQQDVADYVKHCSMCQRNKHGKTKNQPMEITTTAENGFEKIYIDLVGPLTETVDNFKYILSVQDELTKFIEAIPIKTKEAESVAEALVKGVILKHGVPSKIASDQGTEFMNDVFKRMCKLLRIEQINSTAYHHESIGALENTHKSLGAYLRNYVSDKQQDWSEWLPFYVFCYNTSIHLETGYTPFELIYGRECKLPTNITTKIDPVYNYEDYIINLKNKLQTAHRDTREELLKRKQQRKEYYDQYHGTKITEYETGDLVMLKNEQRKKLDPIYTGPYEVIADEKINCRIKVNNKEVRVHKNRIKPFYL